MKYYAISIAGLVLACATVSAGEVFKWVDSQGKVHYGDRPQSGAAQTLKIAPSPAVDESLRQRREAPNKQPKPEPGEEEKKKPGQITSAKEARQEMAKQCDDAKRRQEKYQGATMLFEQTDNGERRILSNEERLKAIENTKQEREKWCE
ncbi:MAG: DUF4124 domain-containing protein [Gammaproteobacteria bacterium]|nr:DUF4124 domain-containing protein [Gammaproteobacteria bacterium]